MCVCVCVCVCVRARVCIVCVSVCVGARVDAAYLALAYTNKCINVYSLKPCEAGPELIVCVCVCVCVCVFEDKCAALSYCCVS
jgi:hypothetical protein